MQSLTKRVSQAGKNEDFCETDLQTWTFLFNEVKQQMNTTTSATINIEEDQTKPLIYDIRMTSSSLNININERHRSVMIDSSIVKEMSKLIRMVF